VSLGRVKSSGMRGHTISTRGSKETGDLISEGCIVSMFHDGHELDHIVTEFVDPGQDIGGEFRKGADAMFCGGDAD
jgi:hypothetical protein